MGINSSNTEIYKESWDSTSHNIKIKNSKTFEETWSLGENGYVKLSNSIRIEWFTGTTMKNSTTLNRKTFPTAFTSGSSYSCTATIKGDSGDTNVGGSVIIYNSSESGGIVMRYVNNSGSLLVHDYKAIAIGY